MKTERRRTFEEISPLEARLERQRLVIGRYVKSAPRDPEKRRILLELAIERARMAEQDDYLRVGFRKRRVKL